MKPPSHCNYIIVLLLLLLLSLPAVANAADKQAELDEMNWQQEIAPDESAARVKAILRIETGRHTASIENISIDADERFLLTTSTDKTLRLWDVKTGNLIQTFRVPIGRGLEGQLYAGSISPDGEWIAGAGWTGWSWNAKASVYVFKRKTGKLKRIADIPHFVHHLAFSKDGKYLAGVLRKGEGLYVWSVADGFRLAARDSQYTDAATWVDFDRKGRIVTASRDGHIRLYDHRFRLVKKVKVPGGSWPFSAVFSPAGDRVAVGFADSTTINVLSGNDLTLLYEPDTKGIDNGNLSRVQWSRDGRFLYAGGSYVNPRSKREIIRWTDGGSGPYVRWAATEVHIRSLRSLKGGELAYGTLDSTLRVLDSRGSTRFKKRSLTADFRGLKKLRISHNGASVQFGFKKNDDGRARFDLEKRLLIRDTAPGNLSAPRRKGKGLKITGWKNEVSPKLNGKNLVDSKYERSRAFAISPDEKHFLLGMNSSLRVFDRQGKQIWRARAPGITRSVNISGDGRLAVAAYSDGTIRWYSMEDGSERLALFPYNGGERWIVWTREGFFDASPGAETLIGFHLNRGQGRPPAFVGVDQLYDSLYRPDLVMKKLMGGHDRELIEAANRIRIDELLAEGGLPPTVSIISPASYTVVNQQNVPVTICLNDQGGGFGKVIYRLNGITLGIDDSAKRGIAGVRKGSAVDCEVPLSRSLNLEPGENRLMVTAFNEQNRIESRPVSIDLIFEETVSNKPDLYVIAIGINEYRDSSLKLKYSVGDAEAIARALQDSSAELFNEINLMTLVDAKAKTSDISNIFKEVSVRIKPHDVFVFYVAAHGIALDGVYYMIPQELVIRNEDDIRRSAINQDMLQKWLSSIPVHKSVVLLDTCNSGAFVNAGARGLAEKTAIDKLIRATGRVTIAASASNQEALEGYEGHGVFTYVLLKALEGLADKNGNQDSVISINEISEYVADEVPKLTMDRWGREQFPMQSLRGRSFPIGLVR